MSFCGLLYFHLFIDEPFLSDRQWKDELEQRMSVLQESRQELMVQLEGLMKLLKVRASTDQGSSSYFSDLFVHLHPQFSFCLLCDVKTG